MYFEASNRSLLQRMRSDFVDSFLGRLESRLGILGDYDSRVPTNYFMAITTVTFFLLLVTTPTLAVVDS